MENFWNGFEKQAISAGLATRLAASGAALAGGALAGGALAGGGQQKAAMDKEAVSAGWLGKLIAGGVAKRVGGTAEEIASRAKFLKHKAATSASPEDMAKRFLHHSPENREATRAVGRFANEAYPKKDPAAARKTFDIDKKIFSGENLPPEDVAHMRKITEKAAPKVQKREEDIQKIKDLKAQGHKVEGTKLKDLTAQGHKVEGTKSKDGKSDFWKSWKPWAIGGGTAAAGAAGAAAYMHHKNQEEHKKTASMRDFLEEMYS